MGFSVRPVPSVRPRHARPVRPVSPVRTRNRLEPVAWLSNTTWFGQNGRTPSNICGFPTPKASESDYPTLPRFRGTDRDGTGTGRNGTEREQEQGSREEGKRGYRPYGPC